MILRLLFTLSVFSVIHAHSQTMVWEITDTVPRPVVVPAGFSQIVMCYLYPGERFLGDTSVEWHGLSMEVFKQDGNSGFIRKENIRLAADQVPFRITYPRSLFCFSSDTSSYARTPMTMTGWSTLLYDAEQYAYWEIPDSFRIPEWTERAYAGDTAAMKLLLYTQYGDNFTALQYGFNKWKLLNHWSDDSLADLLLHCWVENDRIYPEAALESMYTPFGSDHEAMINYLRLYYPMTHYLLMYWRTNPPRDDKTFRRLQRTVKSGKVPANEKK